MVKLYSAGKVTPVYGILKNVSVTAPSTATFKHNYCFQEHEGIKKENNIFRPPLAVKATTHKLVVVRCILFVV